MIRIHPDIIDQLEEWVRSDSRRSIALEPEVGAGSAWRLLLVVTTFGAGRSLHHHSRIIIVGLPGGDLAMWVRCAIEELSPHTAERVQLPVTDDQYDWLYAWPSHRIERSHRLMLHMLEHDKPWTGRYLSD